MKKFRKNTNESGISSGQQWVSRKKMRCSDHPRLLVKVGEAKKGMIFQVHSLNENV